MILFSNMKSQQEWWKWEESKFQNGQSNNEHGAKWINISFAIFFVSFISPRSENISVYMIISGRPEFSNRSERPKQSQSETKSRVSFHLFSCKHSKDFDQTPKWIQADLKFQTGTNFSCKGPLRKWETWTAPSTKVVIESIYNTRLLQQMSMILCSEVWSM